MNKKERSKQADKPIVIPKKRLGQNFLTDRNAILKMVGASGVNQNDTVLEIGPGTGSLTRELAKIAKKVVAVEIDPEMTGLLKGNLAGFTNVEVIRADILEFDEKKLCPRYKVVANVPFYLTAPAIRKFLESDNPPVDLTLIVQKEVAWRIAAKPGDMSILAVSVQLYAEPRVIRVISRNCFWPIPNVDSAILKITPKKERLEKQFVSSFFEIAKAGFSQPRKQLINNFSKNLRPHGGWSREETESWLKNSKVESKQRAETLSVDQWISLTKAYSTKS